MARKDDDEPVLWLELLKSIGVLALAVVNLAAAIFEWIAVALRLRSDRTREAQLDGSLDGDVGTLLETVKVRAATAAGLTKESFGQRFGAKLDEYDIERDGLLPAMPIIRTFFASAWSLFEDEAHDIVEAQPAGDSIAKARYLDYLIDRANRLKDPEAIIRTFVDAVASSFATFAANLSKLAFAEDEPAATFATIPLLDTVKDAPRAIGALIGPFIEDDVSKLGLFAKLRLHYGELARDPKVPRLDDFTGPPKELIDRYFRGTAFEDLFDTAVPFNIPVSRLLEHCVIVAGSGHGKTQTLGAMIANHLTQKEPPALVVIDSTGALTGKVQTLALFDTALKDRIVIIDPEHDPLPALNMFDISNPRLQGYSASMRDSIESEIVSLFNYIFTSAQNDLTSRQGTVFSYVVRLVLSMPNATVHTLLDVLEEDPKGGYVSSRYRPHIDALDATARSFFKNQYFGLKSFREQIAGRLYDLIKVGAFERMFTTSNRVDFYDELQNKGSIILINTSERVLKGEASTLFGRYAIARTMAAAFERAAIPEQKRRPTFLIIDEAAPYFDDTFDKLLTRVRQYKLGVCLAFQHMEQASEKLRSSIASNTSVKLAGGLGYTDSRWLSRDMETTPEFLKAQHRDHRDPPQWTKLACFVRNYTPSAVSLTIPFYALEQMPQMTAEEHRALVARNSERICAPPALTQSAPAMSPVTLSVAEPVVPAASTSTQPERVATPASPPPPQATGDAASHWE